MVGAGLRLAPASEAARIWIHVHKVRSMAEILKSHKQLT